ncbi:MAG: hypothetical protein ACYDAS_02615 [Patescibacteria group bacterium]
MALEEENIIYIDFGSKPIPKHDEKQEKIVSQSENSNPPPTHVIKVRLI